MGKLEKLPSVEGAFDAGFYKACYADLLGSKTDPLAHYRKVGWKSGRNPSPYFSTSFYLAANPDVREAAANPFEHFLNSPDESRPYASPVFDPAYYLDSNPDVRPSDGAIEHYWKIGRHQGRSPSILFDVPHYRSQLGRSHKGPIDYLKHYLSIGWKQDLSPHPLFDPVYYRSQLKGPAAQVPPLAHYLEAGWREGLSPHILFDPEHYMQNAGEVLNEPPLVHYLKRTSWISTPHYLFSDAYYVTAVRKGSLGGSAKDYRGGPPLVHYCRVGARHNVPTHPLFDVQHYKTLAQGVLRDRDDPTAELAELEANPLRHYCEWGVAEGLSPTPLFDPEYYRSQFDGELAGDPLRHYLLPQGFSVASPHPAIDVDYYASQKPDFIPGELPVILDFLMTANEDRVSPHPFLNPKFYRERNPDIGHDGRCPIQHFLEHGMKEARQPNQMFTYPYAQRLCVPGHPRFWNPVDGYFRARGSERPRVLFLGHDASLSGAPLVLLALIKHLAAVADIECITVLGAGGALVDSFVETSFTYIVANHDREFLEWDRHSKAFVAEMSEIADLLEKNPPALIVGNSLESRHLADFFASRGFGPLVTLVHEVADPYDGAQISRLLDSSEQAVFVSEYQLASVRRKLVFDESKAHIVQFGALDKWFGSGDRKAARHDLRAELGLSSQARIVLGCGTMNFRKGIDLFTDVACEVLSRTAEADDLHFVWVGGGPTHYDSAFYWAEKSVRDNKIEARIHFVGERHNTEPYFLASDLFLLTSRADPFPCVIQEAMACGVPIVAFEGKSGAPEAYKETGVTVPFGVAPMAEAVHGLLNDAARLEQLRQKTLDEHRSKKTMSAYADEVFSVAGRAAPVVSGGMLEQAQKLASADEGQLTVYVAMESWEHNEQSQFAEHLVRALGGAGLRAELLFTRGPGIFNRNDKSARVPDAPFSFLHPNTQAPEHVREALTRRLAASRGQTVLIPFADNASFDSIEGIPPHVGTIALLHGHDEAQLERVHRLSRHFDHVVCTSPGAMTELLQSNANLQKKLTFVPTRISTDSDRADAAIAARARRTEKDPIGVVCSGFGNLDAVLNCVQLAKLLRAEKVPFQMSMFVDAASIKTVRAVASDFIRSGVLTLVECPASAERMAVLERSDVLVFASWAVGTEIGIAEAMASGCLPILQQTDSTYAPVLKEGVSCHFIEGSDLRKVAKFIADLQRNPNRLAQMSQTTSRVFRKELANEQRMAKEYASACLKALEHREHKTAGRTKLGGWAMRELRSG